MPGPKLQNDLSTVITRWRQWRVAFCSDVKMMFRQIHIMPGDEHLQRIVWSPSETEPAAHYALLTVTSGTSCALYLSSTLQQRLKWERPRPNLAVEDMVVVMDASLLRVNGSWPLGRVTVVHPGSDERIRAADVRTAAGVYNRPIIKLPRLPLTVPEIAEGHVSPPASL